MPIRRKIFTLTKAPIAHKNWSKEQYKLQFFFFKVSFKNVLIEDYYMNPNHALLMLLSTKKSFSSFETNLFFLKSYYVMFCFNNTKYFNYNSLK